MAHYESSFLPFDYFVLDADVEAVSLAQGGAYGIYPRTSGSIYLEADGRSFKGIGAIIFEDGNAYLTGWDTTGNTWYNTAKYVTTPPVTSIGVAYTNSSVTLRINKQDTTLNISGDFTDSWYLIDTLWLIAQGSNTHVRFDNICSDPVSSSPAPLPQYSLTISKTGTGSGAVTSTPSGISCGSDCTEKYDHGTSVILTASPDADSTFTGWSGGSCSGIGTCTIAVSSDTTITASFTKKEAAMPLPTSQEVFVYTAVELPLTDITPSLAKPIGVGVVASKGNTYSLKIDTGKFAGPVDLYLAYLYPAKDNILYLVDSNNNPTQEIVPWKTAVTSAAGSLFGDVEVSSWPGGTYYVALLAIPSGGDWSSYYFWITAFVIDHISIGTETASTVTQIGTGGNTIVVNNANDPLNGLQLNVPSGSYSGSREFKLSSAPIVKHRFGSYFNPVTPIINVNNGGGYSKEIMTIKIPVKVPSGYFAMGYIYDDKNGTLEGLPTIAQDADSITVATRHFTPIVVTMIDEVLLKKDIDTHFRPGIDDWQFVNSGSYIAKKGHCTGQSMTSMWYYYEQPDGTDLTLYGRYDNNGDKPATPDFQYDDSLGYRLASVVWKDMDWASLSRKITEQYIAQIDANTWRLFAYSMLLTGQPQMTEIWDTTVGGGHAMVVYRIFNGHLYIADPNYPANTERRIEYADGKFTPYSSGENAEEIAKAIAEGKPLKEYDKITYVAKTALSDWDKIGAHWAEFKNKTIGNDYFPAYTITYKDDKGVDHELKDGYIAQGNLININVKGNFVWYLTIYIDGKLLRFDANGNIALKPGNNRLGLYVTGKTGVDENGKNIYKYVDFKYINVISGPTITTLSPDTGSIGTAVTITGTGFGATQGTGTVTFNGTAATVTAWSDTQITTTVPTGATTGNVVVTVGGVASNGVKFTVAADGNIKEFSVNWVVPGGNWSTDKTFTIKCSGNLKSSIGAASINKEFDYNGTHYVWAYAAEDPVLFSLTCTSLPELGDFVKMENPGPNQSERKYKFKGLRIAESGNLRTICDSSYTNSNTNSPTVSIIDFPRYFRAVDGDTKVNDDVCLIYEMEYNTYKDGKINYTYSYIWDTLLFSLTVQKKK